MKLKEVLPELDISSFSGNASKISPLVYVPFLLHLGMSNPNFIYKIIENQEITLITFKNWSKL